MRLLLASDLHYRLRQIDWIAGVASQFDVVAIAGDSIDAFSAVPGEVQIEALGASYRVIAASTRLLLCSGNHDLDERSDDGEKQAGWIARLQGDVAAVDGESITVGATLFTVCPWWDGPQSLAGVEAMLERAAGQRDGDWIWLYHAPPDGPLSWTGRRHYGDAQLPELIERHQPSAVLCGHIHEAPFKNEGGWTETIGNTRLFNAGNQIGDLPAHIDIDFAAGTARWVSLAGIEDITMTEAVPQ